MKSQLANPLRGSLLLFAAVAMALSLRWLADAFALPLPETRLRRGALGATWLAGALGLLAGACFAGGLTSADPKRRGRVGRALFAVAVALGLGAFAAWPAVASLSDAAPLWKGLAFAAALFLPFAAIAWSAARCAAASGGGRLAGIADALLFNAALLLVLGELGLRAIGLVSNSPLFLPRDVASEGALAYVDRWRLNPAAKFEGWLPNSRGYYDDEFALPKPTDAFRIVALADSFGRGSVPKPFNFLTLLEEELDGWPADGKRVDVCNLGVNGIGPAHYLALLEAEAPALQPDLVLLCFFVGNDFSEDLVGEAFASRWEAFYVYRVATRLTRAWRSLAAARGAAGAAAGDSIEGDPTPPHVLDWRLEQPGLPFDYYWRVQKDRTRFFDPKQSDAIYQRSIEIVADIQRAATKLTGRPLVVVVAPDETQVDPELRAKLEAEIGFALDAEKPIRRLREAWSAEGFLLIDPLDALRRGRAETGRVYLLQETHWNANGNRVVAEFIARELRARMPKPNGDAR